MTTCPDCILPNRCQANGFCEVAARRHEPAEPFTKKPPYRVKPHTPGFRVPTERPTQPDPLPGPVDAPLPLWDMTNRELLDVLARDPWRHGAITSTILANRLRRIQEGPGLSRNRQTRDATDTEGDTDGD